jgi:hypothetical protein
MPDTPAWDFNDYLDAVAENQEWDQLMAEVARAKGVAAGTHCRSCSNPLGDDLGPNCKACDEYMEDFNEHG